MDGNRKRSAAAGQPDRPTTESERIDEQQAAAALQKRRGGKSPTRQELAALKRVEKRREERLRWAYYRTIPQKHWREMGGRQAKVLREQAARTGIPFDQAEIDLPAVVAALHQFLADKKHLLWKPGDDLDETAMLGESTPMLEKWREEKWKLARLDRIEREKDLLPRAVVHEGLVGLATILRNLGEQLEKHHGHEALELLNEALDDFDRQLTELFDGLDVPTAGDDDAAGDAQGAA